MAGRPFGRAITQGGDRLMPGTARDIEVLLMIVGAVDGLPVRAENVAEAYKLGAITPAEGKILQRYSRLSPRGKKAAAMRPGDATDAEMQETHERLETDVAKLQRIVEARKAGG